MNRIPEQTSDTQKSYNKLVGKATELAHLIKEIVPNGREQSIAITNLEQAMLWAQSGIVKGGS